MVFEALSGACRDVVESHDRARRRAAERRAARSWTTGEDEILRRGFGEGRTVGELAEELERTPLAAEKRLAHLGLLRIAQIRLAVRPDPVATAQLPEEPAPNQSPDPQPGEVAFDYRANRHAENDAISEKMAEAIACEEEERQRIEEEKFQAMADEYYDRIDRAAAEANRAADEEEDEAA